MKKHKRPLSDKVFEDLMSEARKTNRERSAIEVQSGFAPPESDVVSLISVGISAIEAGIKTLDPPTLAEGLSMIQQAHHTLHSAPQGRVFADIRTYRSRCRRLHAKDN